MNRKLRGQPFLLDKGKIGKLSISVNTKWEVKIVIDSPTISIFPNLTQFVSGSNTISDYLVTKHCNGRMFRYLEMKR